MGYLARNAVADLCSDMPRNRQKIAAKPYPCQVPEAPKVFVSRYLTRVKKEVSLTICQRFKAFLLQRDAIGTDDRVA